ncbi:MAG: hypothetical protein U9R02_16350 [Thermodesulfobacteriota bacterium]|nr:hypothetical protein [Thermodesulfobacteriota bacterium]
MKILFICTANICRSFMAERIFRKKSEENGRSDIEVSSASLIDMEGAPADPMVVDMMKKKGFDGNGHKSKLLTQDMITEADIILAMERRHKEMIIENYPDAEEKVFLLKPFSSDCAKLSGGDMDDIKDPHNLSNYHYRLCFAEIYLAIEGMLKCI